MGLLQRVSSCVCLLLLLSSAALSQLTLTPSSISVTEGSDITLQCGEVNEQFDVKIFFKDDMPKPIDQSRLSSEVEGGMRVFTYTAVEAEENGAMIVCSVLDDTNPTAPVPLTVWFSKLTLQGSSPFSVEENSDLTIYVTLDSNPMENVTVTLDPMPSGYTIDAATSNVSVTFTTVERSDVGSYTLTATNDFTSGSVSFEINVLYPPAFTTPSGDTTVVLPVGQDATLSCVAEGNPEPTISPLNNNVTFTNGQYQFTEPTSTDSGVYGCRASSSSVGYVDTFYTVYFAEPPSCTISNPSVEVQVVMDGDDNFVLSWDFTDSTNGALTTFTLVVTDGSEEMIRQDVAAPSEGNTASTIVELPQAIVPGTTYVFTITGEVCLGLEPFQHSYTAPDNTDPTSNTTTPSGALSVHVTANGLLGLFLFLAFLLSSAHM